MRGIRRGTDRIGPLIFDSNRSRHDLTLRNPADNDQFVAGDEEEGRSSRSDRHQTRLQHVFGCEAIERLSQRPSEGVYVQLVVPRA